MKLEVGKYYRNKGGKKARVLCTDLETGDPQYTVLVECEGAIYWLNSIGNDPYRGEGCDNNLVAEWRDPIKPEGWVAVYSNGMTTSIAGSKEGCKALFPNAVTYVAVRGEEIIDEKSRLVGDSAAKNQRRQLAAKERRARRKEKLAALVVSKFKGLVTEVKDLRMQLTAKDREIEALKGASSVSEEV